MAHEELKKQYEEDWQKYRGNTYKMWEFKSPGGHGWEHLSGPPCWDRFNQYRRKNPPFEPEYFSGLNWRDAEKLVGKLVEFTDDPGSNEWESGVLQCLDFKGGRRFKVKNNYHFEYIRTTPETHAHPTITLTVNGREWVLPRPEVEAPERHTPYFRVRANDEVTKYYWQGGQVEIDWLDNGHVHLTKDRAQAWTDWWENTVIAAIKASNSLS
jgi:hypothetical protein